MTDNYAPVVRNGRTSLDRVRDWVANPSTVLHQADIAWLLREVEAVREYRGEFSVAHRRYTDASVEAARYRREVANLTAVLETINAGADMPLWRRIAMQRRELRAMTFQVSLYQRLWLKAIDERVDAS